MEQSKIDASRNTRILLDYELSPGYKLYQAIIDGVNNNDDDLIDSAVINSINGFYGEQSTEGWLYIINGKISSYKLGKIPDDIINYAPRTNIPNPDGVEIKVLIKRIVPEDYYEPSAFEKLANAQSRGRSNIISGIGGNRR